MEVLLGFVLGLSVIPLWKLISPYVDELLKWNRKKWTYKYYCYIKIKFKKWSNEHIWSIYKAGYLYEWQCKNLVGKEWFENKRKSNKEKLAYIESLIKQN